MPEQLEYDPSKAAQYWGEERFNVTDDEVRAVLGLSQPDAANKAYHDWELTALRRFLPNIKGKVVLDLACGVGRVAVPLSSWGARLTAIDVAPGMVERTRRNLAEHGFPNDDVLRAEASDIPLADGSFDVVVCLGLLEHLPPATREATISEACRVLRPGGELVLETNNAGSCWLNDEQDNSFRLGRQLDNGYFCSLADPAAVRKQLRSLGLEIRGETTNLFYSVVRHTARRAKGLFPRSLYDPAMGVAGGMDRIIAQKGWFDRRYADQMILHASKRAAA